MIRVGIDQVVIDRVKIGRVGIDSGWNSARLGIVSIPKKSKNKQIFTERVRNDSKPNNGDEMKFIRTFDFNCRQTNK